MVKKGKNKNERDGKLIAFSPSLKSINRTKVNTQLLNQ